jgi:hypothetical protein
VSAWRGDRAHRARELGDARLVEGGLHGAPLAPPDLAIGQRQAVAEHRAHHVGDVAAREVFVVVLEQLLQVLRMRDQRECARPEGDTKGRADLARRTQHEAGGVAEHLAQNRRSEYLARPAAA